MKYPAIIKPAGDGWLVTFPDIPEALSAGSTWEEEVAMARDEITAALSTAGVERRTADTPRCTVQPAIAHRTLRDQDHRGGEQPVWFAAQPPAISSSNGSPAAGCAASLDARGTCVPFCFWMRCRLL